MTFASKIFQQPLYYGLLSSLLLNVLLGPLFIFIATLQFDLELNWLKDSIYIFLPSIVLLTFFKNINLNIEEACVNNSFYFIYLFCFLLKLVFFQVYDISGFFAVIFYIISNLFYPLTLIVATQSSKKALILLVLTSLVSIYVSPWRSTSLFFMMFGVIRILNYGNINVRKILMLACTISVFLYFFVRKSSDKFNTTALQTLNTFFYDFGVRSNFVRENAYASLAIENGDQSLLNGYSFEEAIIEIVPSFIYKKSTGNGEVLGWDVARNIGLVSEFDDNTSWSVNFLTEFYLNFGFSIFSLFALLSFYIFFFWAFQYLAVLFTKQYKVLYAAVLFISLFEIVNLTVFFSNMFYSFCLIFFIDRTGLTLFKNK